MSSPSCADCFSLPTSALNTTYLEAPAEPSQSQCGKEQCSSGGAGLHSICDYERRPAATITLRWRSREEQALVQSVYHPYLGMETFRPTGSRRRNPHMGGGMAIFPVSPVGRLGGLGRFGYQLMAVSSTDPRQGVRRCPLEQRPR